MVPVAHTGAVAVTAARSALYPALAPVARPPQLVRQATRHVLEAADAHLGDPVAHARPPYPGGGAPPAFWTGGASQGQYHEAERGTAQKMIVVAGPSVCFVCCRSTHPTPFSFIV
ncbi:hypothetical protein B566_EDAN005933 [Ephemera danica]|nr:hypothetical protein B566_EDAN005933 [Ephemera danica]